MRNIIAIVAVILVMVPGIAVAQDGTPASTGQASVGQPVIIYGPDGAEIAQMTVMEVVDPFEDWSEYMAPQMGERYVVVIVEITNTGTRPFEFAPTDFKLLDTHGYLYWGGGYYRSDVSTATTPELEQTSMLPGESITGALSYVVTADATIGNVVYTTFRQDGSIYSNEVLYLLANLAE